MLKGTCPGECMTKDNCAPMQQNNELTDLSGLGQLHSLTKLYLDGNKIQRVEGLENLSNLEELHVSNQYLPEVSCRC